MALPHPLPADLVELIARRFRVLGEPMRIRLLDHLREGEATVGELSQALDGVAAERLQAPCACSPTPACSAGARTATTSTTGSPTKACSRSARTSAAPCRNSCAASAN